MSSLLQRFLGWRWLYHHHSSTLPNGPPIQLCYTLSAGDVLRNPLHPPHPDALLGSEKALAKLPHIMPDFMLVFAVPEFTLLPRPHRQSISRAGPLVYTGASGVEKGELKNRKEIMTLLTNV